MFLVLRQVQDHLRKVETLSSNDLERFINTDMKGTFWTENKLFYHFYAYKTTTLLQLLCGTGWRPRGSRRPHFSLGSTKFEDTLIYEHIHS